MGERGDPPLVRAELLDDAAVPIGHVLVLSLPCAMRSLTERTPAGGDLFLEAPPVRMAVEDGHLRPPVDHRLEPDAVGRPRVPDSELPVVERLQAALPLHAREVERVAPDVHAESRPPDVVGAVEALVGEPQPWRARGLRLVSTLAEEARRPREERDSLAVRSLHLDVEAVELRMRNDVEIGRLLV